MLLFHNTPPIVVFILFVVVVVVFVATAKFIQVVFRMVFSESFAPYSDVCPTQIHNIAHFGFSIILKKFAVLWGTFVVCYKSQQFYRTLWKTLHIKLNRKLVGALIQSSITSWMKTSTTRLPQCRRKKNTHRFPFENLIFFCIFLYIQYTCRVR